MMSTELDGMVRQEQYKDMIREAREASRVAAARPNGAKSPTKTLLLLPVLLVSVTARLISFLVHLRFHASREVGFIPRHYRGNGIQ